MGSSSATAEEVAARAAYRSTSGTSFAHTATTHRLPRSEQKIHESVDPKRKNTAGVQIRECLDSTEHPLTIPVVVCFDETGSMGGAPRVLQQNLATLKAATLHAGLDDVQLCFGAYGDGQNGEVAPVQVGQFESGLEMEDWLNNLYLEGNGGGNGGETAGLFMYFMGNYSSLDSLNKRGKKGYLIITGDEIPLPFVTKAEVATYIGDDSLEADIPVADVIRQCQESYEIYFFMVKTGSAVSQDSYNVWSGYLGTDHVIQVESLEHFSEQVAMLLGTLEGKFASVSDGIDALVALGVDSAVANKAGSALAVIQGTGVAAHSGSASGALPAPPPEMGANA